VTSPPARFLSRGVGQLVAELELRQPTLVTLAELAALAVDAGVKTPPKVLAARLRAAGWLLQTAQRGVYEFAPGAHAGPYGHGDPFIDLRAARIAEGVPGVVALQSALWLHGMADRTPNRHEVAIPVGARAPEAIRRGMRVVRFDHHLIPADIEELAVHRPATILTHLATKPGDVRGWGAFGEALPELAENSSFEELEGELAQRPGTVRPRLAYLLSGVTPGVADRLQPGRPPNVTWFGTERVSRRFDRRFNIADSTLPFDPRTVTGAA
jgi:predicted transcriptional regulator of viral defense system